MEIQNYKMIKPHKSGVLVELQIPEEYVVMDSTLENNDIAKLSIFKGKVLKYAAGSKKDAKDIAKNKIAIFTEFAGYHLPVKDKLVKLINAYDILAFTDELDMTVNSVTPSNDRLLVSTIDNNDGIVLTDSNDKRELALKFAKVEKVGNNCKLYKVGDIIGYEPFSGEIIKEDEGDDSKELTVIMEDLVLFSLTE